MLVLSRKIGEKVVIGDEIVLIMRRILGRRSHRLNRERRNRVAHRRGEFPRFDPAPDACDKCKVISETPRVPRTPRCRPAWPARPR